MATDTLPTSSRRSVFARFRERLSQRPDTEHEAALIRFVLAFATSGYVIVATRVEGVINAQLFHVVLLIAFVILFSTGILAAILIRPQVSIPRRVLGIAADLGATTYAMHLLGEAATPFIGLYLFNACGNGFRYGPGYLYLSSALGVSGFTFVLLTSDYWLAHQTLGVGLVIVLIVIPMYFASLVRQLHAVLARMRNMATHDTLTGLPNRHLFFEKLQLTLTLAEQNNKPFAVVFVDLDGFKPINDSLGHAAGDAVLKSVARRLEESVRKNDTVARFGGDEFVIILLDIHKEAVYSVARKIIDMVARPHDFDSKTVTLTLSLGIATYPDSGRSADELIAHADAAMYRAKRAEKNSSYPNGEPKTANIPFAAAMKECGT